jgi:hypothetical protein
MIEIELFDGTVLEFPDGTDQTVINNVAKQQTTSRRIAAAKAGTLQLQPGSAERVAAMNEMAMKAMNVQNLPPPQGQTSLGVLSSMLGVEPQTAPPQEKGLQRRALELATGIGAGATRGAAQLVGLPGTALDLINMGMEKVGILDQPATPSPLSGASIQSALNDLTGGYVNYQAPGFLGAVAGTGAELFGGGVGRKAAALGGLGAEALGKATEGTFIEPAARFAGAFFTPMAFSTANKTVNAFMNRASAAPSLQTLQQAKTAAYKAVDNEGISVNGNQTADLANKVKTAVADTNYVPDVDKQTFGALQIIERNAGKPLTLGQLDKIRQGLWTRIKEAPNEVAIFDIIDEVDNLIASLPAATPLMAVARLANSRFKKAELIENAFQKAKDQTASTGSGGNIVNKYRQTVTSIINNPKQAKFFSGDEIAMMRNFVSGSNAENALRLVGKLAPSGNGLMMALNIGAVAANPAMALVSAGASGAKALSQTLAMRKAQSIRDALASGVVPQGAPSTAIPNLLRTVPGLLAQ